MRPPARLTISSPATIDGRHGDCKGAAKPARRRAESYNEPAASGWCAFGAGPRSAPGDRRAERVHFPKNPRRRFAMFKLMTLGTMTAAVLAIAAWGQAGGEKHADNEHVVVRPDEVKWGPAPPGLPAGAQVAVLVGDPGSKGTPYVLRAKLPAGYKVPPHWHSTDENVTVIHGALMIGKG